MGAGREQGVGCLRPCLQPRTCHFRLTSRVGEWRVGSGRVAQKLGGEKVGVVPSIEYRCLDSLFSVALPFAPLSAVTSC